MKQPSQFRTGLYCVLCAALVPLTFAGCSRVKAPEDTQVAVRVNKGEITVHQVQTVLQRQPRLVAAAGEAATGRVVDVLVDLELAAQAARQQGLDQDTNVIQALQGIQREALARAYQERIAAKVPAPSSDEMDRYFESHPELFAERRLYLLNETAVQGSDAQMKLMPALVAQARGVDELSKALRDAGLRFSSRQIASAAEDLPLVVLGQLSKAETGASVVHEHRGGARIFTVLHAIKAPVDRRSGAAAISNFLLSERKRQAVEEAMKQLRGKAKIEYQSAFAPKEAASAVEPAATRP